MPPHRVADAVVAYIGVDNLMAIYVENDLAKLINGRPLKAISHYWRVKIAKY